MSGPDSIVSLVCGNCHKSVSVPKSCLERKITCPHCFEDANDLHAPAGAPAAVKNASPSSLVHFAQEQSQVERVIKLACQNCQTMLEVEERDFEKMGGSSVSCPACHQPCPIPRACPQCGKSCAASTTYCPDCGTNVASKLRLQPSDPRHVAPAPQGFPCPRCNQFITLGSVFCASCGLSLQGGMSAPTQAHRQPIQPVIDEGINRMSYLVLSIVLGLIALPLLLSASSEKMYLVISVVYGILQIIITVNRLQNIGWSGWAVLLMLIPIVNVVLGTALVICQPGYAQEGRLDSAGKTWLWIFVALFGFSILLGFLAASA